MRYILIATVAAALCGCEAQVNDSGALPKVDVDVQTQAGRLPDIKLEGPEVSIGSKTVDLTVPEVSVTMPSDKP